MCPFSALDHEFDNDRLDCCESLQAVRETIRVWGNWGYSTLAAPIGGIVLEVLVVLVY